MARTPRLSFGRVALAWALASLISAAPSAAAPNAQVPEHEGLAAVLASQPLTFEKNSGQAAGGVDFLVRGPQYAAEVSADGLRLLWSGAAADSLEMRFVGASADASARPRELQRRTSSYFLGSNSQSWINAAPHYREISYEGIYPGVDVVYYESDGAIEYDLLFEAGVQPDAVSMLWSAAEAVMLTEEGDLELRVGERTLRQSRPRAFERSPRGEREIPARYRMLSDGRIGLETERQDSALPLRIDPRIGLASYFGGVSEDIILAVRLDSSDGLWIAGHTSSANFPIPEDDFPVRREATDAFLSRLEKSRNSAGERIWEVVATVFLGGGGNDRAVSVDIDPDGKLVVVGDTRSADFPVSKDAVQPSLSGSSDIFIAVIQESDFPFPRSLRAERAGPDQGFPNSYEILYGSYLGGSADEVATEGLVAPVLPEDQPLCPVLAGLSDSPDFPTSVFSLQPARSGGFDGVVVFYCPDSSSAAAYSPIYATYLGGLRPESDSSVAVAPNGSFCVGLTTPSAGLPANGLQVAPVDGNEVYVRCSAPVRRVAGLPFTYSDLGSTYIGGGGDDSLTAIRMLLDSDDAEAFHPLLVMTSNSAEIGRPAGLPDPPETASTVRPGLQGIYSAILDNRLSELRSSFWLGGSNLEGAHAADSDGSCLAIAGVSESANLPVSGSFPQRQNAGQKDAFAAKICFDVNNGFEATTEYSGFLGSSDVDEALAVDLGPNGNEVYGGRIGLPVIGLGTARFQTVGDLPTVAAPQDAHAGGSSDGLLFELFRPRVRPEAVVGAADFRFRAVAPGELISIFGLSLGPDENTPLELDQFGRISTQLGGTRVLFNGVAAPMVLASKNQINAIAPFSVKLRETSSIEVEVDGAKSIPVQIPVATTAPQIFTVNQGGNGPGAILNQNSSANSAQNPALPGSVIQIFMTGGGETTPSGVDGELIPFRQPFPALLADTTVRIGGRTADVEYAGGAPGLLHGVVQINARVPLDTPPNAPAEVEIQIGSARTLRSVTVAVGERLGDQ